LLILTKSKRFATCLRLRSGPLQPRVLVVVSEQAVATLLMSSSSPATMIVSCPLESRKRRIRRFWTLRHPIATMIAKTPSPKRIASKVDVESVMGLPCKLTAVP
jgi:hypothetical protein